MMSVSENVNIGVVVFSEEAHAVLLFFSLHFFINCPWRLTTKRKRKRLVLFFPHSWKQDWVFCAFVCVSELVFCVLVVKQCWGIETSCFHLPSEMREILPINKRMLIQFNMGIPLSIHPHKPPPPPPPAPAPAVCDIQFDNSASSCESFHHTLLLQLLKAASRKRWVLVPFVRG